MELDELMNRFRTASRELFNQYFRIDRPYINDEEWPLTNRLFRVDNPYQNNEEKTGWVLEDRFRDVESILFEKLVLEPAGLPRRFEYGCCNPNISVQLRFMESTPIILNRNSDSEHWDYPLKQITRDAKMDFIRFMDWDSLGYRDNRYVLVEVAHRHCDPIFSTKLGLIEAHYVRFTKPE